MTAEILKPHRAPAIQPGSRDSRLDALRGLFLIVMTIDHLPSILAKFTYEFAGYVSAAEGFVFLSGFVAGLTYTRIGFQHGERMMWSRALKRARTIYLYHIATFLILYFTLRAYVWDEDYWQSWLRLFHVSTWQGVLMGATFLYQPKFLDILPMYCLFVLVTPLMVQRFRKDRMAIVLGVSFTLWILAQFGVGDKLISVTHPRFPLFSGEFDCLAWQGLFVAGVCLGFRRYTRENEVRRVPRVLVYYAFLVAIILFLVRHHVVVENDPFGPIERMAEKRSLGVIRVINFAVFAFLISAGLKSLRTSFFVRGLAYLGRHSLQVFTFQILLCSYIQIFLGQSRQIGELVEVLTVAICVSSLYGVAWCCESRKRLVIEVCL